MKTIKRTSLLSVVFAAGVATVIILSGTCPAADQPATKQSTTLKNLTTAYNGESNAREKYLAYAQKADQEGYRKVAQLFRAAAESDGIHAGMEAKTMTALGGTPDGKRKKPVVKSTKENLQDSLRGEEYESATMYPQFIAQAKADTVKDATIAFGSAQKVEANHVKLYRQALNNIESWKTPSNGFFVCTVCGNVVEKVDFTDCPVCSSPASAYKLVK
jgi:rubrerythrin